jgi:hypothetical protein
LISLEITGFSKTGGPLTKRIRLDECGKVVSDGSACVMGCAAAGRVRLANVHALADMIGNLEPYEAIALGALRPDLPDKVRITTKRELDQLNGTGRPDLIARTGNHILYQPGRPALALLDFDTKGMPPSVAQKLNEAGGFWSALILIIPELEKIAHVRRRSTRAGLYRTDTRESLTGSNGLHVYLVVNDGADVERFLKALHVRCWLAGLGWLTVGAGGQLLERSIVDRMVGAPERLVFEGAPILDPPLAQNTASRRPIASEGDILDTRAACPPLSTLEETRFRNFRAKEEHRLASDRAKARECFVKEQSRCLAERASMEPRLAERVIQRLCAGVLWPDVVLPFDDPDLAGRTVADVLANPGRFEGETLADPIEGLGYGVCKARIMRRADGTPWINSFAHGRTTYGLRYSFAAAKAAIEEHPPNEAARAFVDLVLAADLDPEEVEALRDLVVQRARIGKRALNDKLKAAWREHQKRRAEEERTRQTAERQDPRPQIHAPAPDAPWTEQMDILNAVLSAVRDPEPPARDCDGVYVKVRVRRALNMHAFTSRGANAEEAAETRLPAPEQPLLTRLTEAQLSEEIERYIDYVVETGEGGMRSVHLGTPFVHHFHTRPDDNALPLAAAIATLPVIFGDGTLLTGHGLDRERGIVFRIPTALLSLLPKLEKCTPDAVAAAMRFLCEEWFCDVATDYAGKCILIAAALTVIERSLLPDRPAFWVTAGRRGGGKTTVIIMLMAAVTGVRPAAAAWSPNEEERRKALLAYLLEALPAIIWDNIPRGTQIACPHIEKSCTAGFYSDRRLGVSELVAVSAAVIHFFTGNNIGPRGDLASRSLQARLEVDRADPENREFKHPDPIGWTEANRGKILAALYTILLGNQRLYDSNPPRADTRFKIWFHLVGSAVENAAKQHAERAAASGMEAHMACPPEAISFKDLFLAQEEDDEEAASLADALAVLDVKWPNGAIFQAADVAKLINSTGESSSGADRECGMILREFLFPRAPASQTITAKAVGKRLRRHVGEPVAKDNKTFILTDFPDPHTKFAGYCVVIK